MSSKRGTATGFWPGATFLPSGNAGRLVTTGAAGLTPGTWTKPTTVPRMGRSRQPTWIRLGRTRPDPSTKAKETKKALAAAERPGRGLAKRPLEDELQTQLQDARVVRRTGVQEVGLANAGRARVPRAVIGVGTRAEITSDAS